MDRVSSRFFGTWELEPSLSRFELDAAPSEATTRLMPEPGGLFISVDWVGADGKRGQLAQVLRYGEPTLVLGADVTLRVVDERTFETSVEQDGRTVSRTRRTLLEDGTLEFTQVGTLSNGKSVTNVQRYRRKV